MEKLVISHSPHCRLRCQRFTAGNLGFALGYLRSSAFAASVQFCAAIVFKNIRRYRSLRIKHGNIIERPVAWALVLTISLLPLAASCQLVAPQRMAPEAVGGVLNLSGWDFVTDGPVNLSGEWEFYWQQHLDPHDFARSNPSPRTGYIRLPGYWNGYDVDGKTLSGDGYATYRLRVQLKPANRHIALRLLEISTAYSLYLNGEKVGTAGVAGKNRQTTVPRYSPQIVDFKVEFNPLEIILQVSNFHHRRGGIWEGVQLGSEQDIRSLQEGMLGLDLFLLGSILIMGLYHLALFWFRKKERSALYFGIFCFLILVRLLTTGERYLLKILPSISWELMVRLEYLSFYLAVPAFALFMRSIFQDFSRRIFIVIAGMAGAFACVVVLAPPRLFSYTLNAYEIFTLAVAGYGFYVIMRALPRKKVESLVFLCGFIILSLAMINDMLHVERVIQTGFYAPFGLFVFILSQASLLSFRFSKALTTVEQQGKELKQTFEAYKSEIIDRKKAESALLMSEEKYRTILHSIEDGYYEVDLAGNMTFFNESLCRILGYSRDELLGMNNRRVMSSRTAQRVYETFNRVYRTGEAAKALDWELISKEGGTKFIETSVSLMRDSQGRPIGFRGIARDVTERKHAEEQAKLHQQQLMQAGKMVALGTLVSGVAHEINNPNNFIMLNTPILREAWENALPVLDKYYAENGDFIIGGMKFTEMRENMPTLFSGISDGARRIKQIVEDLKHYTRNEAADLTQGVDINAVLQSAVSLLSGMIRKFTDHFRADYGTDLPRLTGNFQRLEQVFVNLIQNACQALPDPHKGVFVSTAYDPARSRIVIVVRDEGSGIPSENLPHIFDPLFTTRQNSGGVGLGLSISSRIVAEHGGTMFFASEVGAGTTATVRLPVEPKNKASKGMNP
jgi:PAS domain S-box-containing protein